MSVFSFMVGPESLLYSYSCKQVCCEQCLSRRNGSTIAIARFCRLSASNSLIEFASSGFKTKKTPILANECFQFYGRAGELVIFLLLQTSLLRAVPFASQRLNHRNCSVLPAIRFELSYRVRFFRL